MVSRRGGGTRDHDAGTADTGAGAVAVALAAGRPLAADLLPTVYRELKKVAAAMHRRLRPGDTLQATAIVHEAYAKLVARGDPGWDGRRHFLGAAAQAMREIIVDHLRSKSAVKRGLGKPAEDIDVAIALPTTDIGLEDVLAVDAALGRLELERPRAARVVVMRYFAGMSEAEIADAIAVTPRTVQREWRVARAWLHAALFADPA